jgi:Transposase DDE domain
MEHREVFKADVICPAGQATNYGGRSHRNRAWTYIGTQTLWCVLPKTQCTNAAFSLPCHHQHEPARQRARELANTPKFAHAQRQRKKVEALFAELKNQIRLRYLRRLKFVWEQFFLAAVTHNIKRLVRAANPQELLCQPLLSPTGEKKTARKSGKWIAPELLDRLSGIRTQQLASCVPSASCTRSIPLD